MKKRNFAAKVICAIIAAAMVFGMASPAFAAVKTTLTWPILSYVDQNNVPKSINEFAGMFKNGKISYKNSAKNRLYNIVSPKGTKYKKTKTSKYTRYTVSYKNTSAKTSEKIVYTLYKSGKQTVTVSRKQTEGLITQNVSLKIILKKDKTWTKSIAQIQKTKGSKKQTLKIVDTAKGKGSTEKKSMSKEYENGKIKYKNTYTLTDENIGYSTFVDYETGLTKSSAAMVGSST